MTHAQPSAAWPDDMAHIIVERSIVDLDEGAARAELRRRVANGAKVLDSVRPDWAAGVAGRELEMASCDRCVLGHLYGEYKRGYELLRRQLPRRVLFSAAGAGFTLHPAEQRHRTGPFGVFLEDDALALAMTRFGWLADAWREAIRARTSPLF